MGDTTTGGQLLVPIPDAMYQLGGLGRTTIYQLIDSEELVRVNIGRRAFITAASIRAFVLRQSGDAPTSAA